MFPLEDTIVALATPPGAGAIAVIRLSGDRALEICNGVFKGKNLAAQPSHTLHFGKIENAGETLDEVVVSIFRAPHSYTKEDVVEVSCHGSVYVQQRLLEVFLKKGARLAKPGEFTLRAFLNGRMDLAQAEAVADLIQANSEAAHRAAIQQMRGGFSKQIARLREELIQFAALVELELDFSEEDIEFADRNRLTNLVNAILIVLKTLMDSFQLGNVIKNGVTTVIAGRPNVGKSTLLNALLNEERAIVSEIPGTTRDTIEEAINIGGVLFRLVDTAGIRRATDKIEQIGVQRTFEKIKEATVIIYVFDISVLTPEELQNDLAELQTGNVVIFPVGNKTDLDVSGELAKRFHAGNILFISSKTQAGIDALKNALLKIIFSTLPTAENTIITNIRHWEALQKAHEALNDVLKGINRSLSGEWLSADIRRALQFLGEITGEITTDDLLDNIFSKFCIGK